MLATAKKISLFCAIAAAVNIVVGVLLLLYLQTVKLGFAVVFCLSMYLVTTSGILLGITCALRSASSDIVLDTEYLTKDIVSLKKKVHELENRS